MERWSHRGARASMKGRKDQVTTLNYRTMMIEKTTYGAGKHLQ